MCWGSGVNLRGRGTEQAVCCIDLVFRLVVTKSDKIHACAHFGGNFE